MASEFMKIIEALSKEKGISKDVLFDVIETNLQVAYKNNFKKEENSHVVGKVRIPGWNRNSQIVRFGFFLFPRLPAMVNNDCRVL